MEKLNVRLTGFEGPLDLLLHLIDKNEIDIYDIPIAELTEQYMEFIESHSMESMSEFILMAATLLEIKSKMLLPLPQKDEQGVDPRQELVEKLIEYKRYRQAAESLAARGGVAERVFRTPDSELIDMLKSTLEKQPGDIVSELLGGISLDGLFDVFESVLMRQELRTDKVRSGFNSVEREIFTVDDKILFIRSLIAVSRKLSFREIFANGGSRMEIVVTFLAVLELIKRDEIKFRQENAFDDIMIFRRGEPA
jgi:segregation and condensation protein A